MLTLLVFAFGKSLSYDDALLPVDLLESGGFQARAVNIQQGTGSYAEFVRKADGARLDLQLHSLSENGGRKLYEPMPGEESSRVSSFLPQSLSNLSLDLPSKLPLGVDFRWRSTPKMLQVLAMTEHEVIGVTFSGARENADKALAPFVEKVARVALARLVARRVGGLRKTLIDGHTVTVATNATIGLELIDAKEWASARGWKTTLEANQSITLAKGSHKILLPLGSGSLRMDGKWIDLPDAIAEKEGRWFVPKLGLEQATAN